MMRWNDEELYADVVQEVIAQVHQMDRATPLPPTLRARVQTTIEALVPGAPFAPASPPSATELVTRLAAFLDLEEGQAQQLLQALATAAGPPWTPSGLPGLSLLPLAGGPRVADATCGLGYIAPGKGLPHHRHQGDEWTLVLYGWVQEDDGHRWGPGDCLHRAPGSVHAFYALEPTPCVCALVSYGGVEFVAVRPEAEEERMER
jgi:hypothetical protein